MEIGIVYIHKIIKLFFKISQNYEKVIVVTGKEYNNPIFEILKRKKICISIK